MGFLLILDNLSTKIVAKIRQLVFQNDGKFSKLMSYMLVCDVMAYCRQLLAILADDFAN